jgi:hypothetical protein
MPRFTHRKVIPISATVGVVAQRTPETLTLVRHRALSTAETIARLAVTAIVAYLVGSQCSSLMTSSLISASDFIGSLRSGHGLPLSPPSLRRRAAAPHRTDG